MNEEKAPEFISKEAEDMVARYIDAARKAKPPEEDMMAPFEHVLDAVRFCGELFAAALYRCGKLARQRDQAERNYMELLKENHALCESRKTDMEENAALRSKRDTLQMANKWLAEENLKLREEKKSLNIQVTRLQDRLDRTIEERIRRWFE